MWVHVELCDWHAPLGEWGERRLRTGKRGSKGRKALFGRLQAKVGLLYVSMPCLHAFIAVFLTLKGCVLFPWLLQHFPGDAGVLGGRQQRLPGVPWPS